MPNKSLILLFVSLFCAATAALAMPPANDSTNRFQRFYIGNSLDAGIFSASTLQKSFTGTIGSPAHTTNTISVLRFSYVINYGVSFNFNLTRQFGIFTGVDLKNVGFIEHENGETIKRRTYNLGAPLGLKFGNLQRNSAYLFIGGGLDVPVNYREKEFVHRNQKTKFSEWFSDRTPAVMPYVFIGAKFRNNCTIKFQYYTNNYLNPDFASGGVQPYAGYNVHLMLLSLGYHLQLGKHKDMVKKSVTKLNTNSI